MLFTDSDKSACKRSLQIEGYCPYQEMQIAVFNSVSNKKKRCEKKECLNILLKATNSDSEKEALKKIGRQDLLKPEGPAEQDVPTSNIHIDSVLHDMALASVKNPGEYKNNPMYHVPFQMYDFHKPGVLRPETELWALDLNKLMAENFKSFCCVLNTDKSYGMGKHWVCIFGLYNNNSWHIDYFNSSSNGLDRFKPLLKWVDHLNANYKFKVTIKECIFEPLQYDDHSCGIWCLIFIKTRLQGLDANFMQKNHVNDSDMMLARKYLFT